MDINRLFSAFSSSRIAVIGDIMLDKYIFGHVSRISPESPVPVVDVSHESCRLGGAANVAVNLRSMGASVQLCGVTGADSNHAVVSRLLDEHGIAADNIISDPARPTTCKTRILSQSHHITRVDHESRQAIDESTENDLLERFTAVVTSLDAVVLEDYNKGVLTTRLITGVIASARQHGVPVLVDPKHQGFFAYQDCTLFKPNLSEISVSLGIDASNRDPDVEEACRALQKKLRCDHIVVTRSEKGLTVCNESCTHIPAASLDVADVSGAGDTVIAMLALGLAVRLDVTTSAEIANLAAASVCQEVGAVPIKPDRLRQACLAHFPRASGTNAHSIIR
ncbi:D-glycero-beta-D-manno-heptose-7-phosphate kinase [Prosthecochloris sp. ZM_2]|uniref:D-glycero-beta-D-manno-heptose-7-phosphate kinase n=1 Tax=Prosthecochloris sp. ZM_2 TaxID=2045206 RepID=UPI000DF757DA|nr:D-glycero-beta-D-manno-heptose-7-phosphate kinase [Prosthecochloris sp. ZM_2]RNA64979.1 D-glycero-beta-D-manno-heptose-7-phosphate kinase [Prosthecochloris sp. ZM_2]